MKVFFNLFGSLFFLAFSLAISVAIFTFIPALNYHQFVAQTRAKKTFQASLAKVEMDNQQPQMQQPPQKAKSSQKSAKSADQPKSLSSSRFAMDLGSAGLMGGRTGGVAMGMTQMGDDQSYSEGEADTDARLVRFVPPKFPEEAQKAGVRGTVSCLLTIGENGKVIAIEYLETPGEYGFREVIGEAVSKWVFEPATVGGVPVKQKLEQPFKF